jgi:hypothetical protein
VRIALMRSTIHLVTARDCLVLRPLLQAVLDRGCTGNFGRQLAGLDLDDVAAAGRVSVEERPRTFDELGTLLKQRWPERDAAALAIAVRTRVPLVQVPPRGVWGEGGLARHTSAEHWLEPRAVPKITPDDLVLRYLAAFGPATVRDVQKWSGLTRLKEVLERLRPNLVTFSDEHGNELFDRPEAPRPGPDTTAPPRFLPEFDNVLLSHADRTRIISDEHRKLLFSSASAGTGSVLVDGFVAATWKVGRTHDRATLRVEPLFRLSKRVQATVADEGAELLALLEPRTATTNVEFSYIPA